MLNFTNQFMRYLFYLLTPVVLLLLAFPRPAHAYVDPGSGAMLWQLAAAAVIGSIFYVRRVVGWIRKTVGLRSSESDTTTAKPLPRR